MAIVDVDETRVSGQKILQILRQEPGIPHRPTLVLLWDPQTKRVGFGWRGQGATTVLILVKEFGVGQ
jgi:hypothetical protein